MGSKQSPERQNDPVKFCFSGFEVDTRTRELRRHGVRVRLQDQPLRILILLLERPEELVTRDELRERIWPADTFVEFEHSLNTSINKLRRALNDSAENPRYVETIPRRGYRFIGSLQTPPTAYVKPATGPSESRSERRHLSPTVWLSLVTIVAVLLAGIGWRRIGRGLVEGFNTIPLTTYRGVEGSPTFSPNGDQVAFTWNGPGEDNVDIYVKAVGSVEALRLTFAPALDDSPAWSPDGRWIAFVRRHPDAPRGEVFLISPLGGPGRKIGETVFADMKLGPTLAWTSDSKWLAVRDDAGVGRPRGLYLLSIDTGESRLLLPSPTDEMQFDFGAAFSSDGKRLAFSRNLAIHVVELDGLSVRSMPRPLTERGSAFELWPAWTVDEKEIIFARRAGLGPSGLWRVSASGGTALPIPNTGSTFIFEPTIARKGGRLAYSERSYISSIWQLSLNQKHAASAPPTPIVTSSRFDGTAALSPNTKRVAFTSNRTGSEQIWVANIDGSHQVQLTHYPRGMFGSVAWSPDGRFVTYDAIVDRRRSIVVQSVENGGLPSPITDHGRVPNWSADGKWIYFSSNKGGPRGIWRKPFAGGEEVRLTQDGGLVARESPDGRIFCYFTPDPERLWMAPMKNGVPDLNEKQLISEEASWFVFDVSNAGVYFAVRRDSDPYSLPRFGPLYFYDFSTGHTSNVVQTGEQLSFGLSVSRDEKTVIYSQAGDSRADLMLIEPFR